MTTYRIPFNRPPVLGSEMACVADAAKGGRLSGDGPYTAKCHDLLASTLGARKVLLTTSCTHALEMSALLLDIREGDEVIVPSFGFVSTINAFVLRGATPVFVDIRPDTLNLDENKVDAAITDRTRAMVPIHYAGVACDMDRLMALSQKHGIPIVEDNAHGIFGKYRGRPLGSFGALATLSFHETKNITCGEGGALLINDTRYMERAEIIREKGTNRSRFFRGEVDKYTWVDLGSSYLPSEILAAFLYAQLIDYERIQTRRKALWDQYFKRLKSWADENSARLPAIPSDCDQSFHMFHLILPSETCRSRVIAHLKERGILSVFHYLPLHLSDMGRRFGGQPGDFPVTEDLSERLLRLPFYYSMTDAEQDEVCTTLTELTL